MNFQVALLVADAEMIGRAAIEAGCPVELARVAGRNALHDPGMVAALRTVLGMDDLGVAMAMIDPAGFMEGLAGGPPGDRRQSPGG